MVSVHRIVIESRPVDPGSIRGSHRPISFIRVKHRTRANFFFFLKLSIHSLVHKKHTSIINEILNKHAQRTCLMYHACKVEFQPFNRSHSQLTFFNFYFVFKKILVLKNVSCEYDRWVVETLRCKLRDSSDTLIGRAYYSI